MNVRIGIRHKEATRNEDCTQLRKQCINRRGGVASTSLLCKSFHVTIPTIVCVLLLESVWGTERSEKKIAANILWSPTQLLLL